MPTEHSSAGRAPRRVRWPVLVSPLAVLILLAGAAALWPDLAPRPRPPAETPVFQFPAEPSLLVFPFDDLGPGGREVRVRDRCAVTGAGLNQNLVPSPGQFADGLGHKGDAPFVGRSLLDGGNPHAGTPSVET